MGYARCGFTCAALLLPACFSTNTLGLPCENDTHCDGGQSCIDGLCAIAPMASDSAEGGGSTGSASAETGASDGGDDGSAEGSGASGSSQEAGSGSESGSSVSDTGTTGGGTTSSSASDTTSGSASTSATTGGSSGDAWCQDFDGLGQEDRGWNIAFAENGNVAVVGGAKNDAGPPAWHPLVAVYAPDGGTPIWSEVDTGLVGELHAAAFNSDSELIVVGTVDGGLWTRYYSETGVVMSTTSINAFSGDRAAALDIINDHDLLIVGSHKPTPQARSLIYVGRFDSAGSELWSDTYTSDAAWDAQGYGLALVPDGTGTSYIAGSTGVAVDDWDAYIAGYTGGGTRMWGMPFDPGNLGGVSSQHTHVALDPSGDLVVGGTYSRMGTDLSLWLERRSTATGSSLGDPTYHIHGDPLEITGLHVDTVGRPAISAHSADTLVTARYSSDLATQSWSESRMGSGGSTHSAGQGVRIDADGGVLVVGTIARGATTDDRHVITCRFTP